MWQRIQTLYFALCVGILLALTFGTAGTIYTSDAPIEDVKYLSKLPYAVLIILSLIANLAALFSWSKRSLQIRLAGASATLLLALQIWLIVDYFTMGEGFVFKWTCILPAFAFVFDLLAIKGIYADELLVQSASRLRSSKRKNK